MEKLDFSPLEQFSNNLALQLTIFIGVTLILGFIVVYILKLLRIPSKIASPLAGLATLYIAYKVFTILS
ncbi:hypothetical protein [Bacillus suaedaesalsae]|uniref:Uncharacterized protein n=1 Tax=Bacillus suaedaesalsae TaxID=2810349 RepID=A0ABS2DGZ0_9BACI|nr:hypothetical protein [Bacillus suaedaesalsae]MBM6617729.1 hypothetical protein [Bacillus suaedaesalsae]